MEAGSNTMIGYAISVWLGQWVYPFFGYDLTLQHNAMITGIFVAVSLFRSYLLRRFYESKAWQTIRRFSMRLTSRVKERIKFWET